MTDKSYEELTLQTPFYVLVKYAPPPVPWQVLHDARFLCA